MKVSIEKICYIDDNGLFDGDDAPNDDVSQFAIVKKIKKQKMN